MNVVTSAANNVSLGYGTLQSLTSGERNIAIGNLSLDAITTQNDSIAIGQSALSAQANSNATRNIAIGQYAMENMNAWQTDNIAIGYEAMEGATTHADIDCNIAIGSYALDDIGGAGVGGCIAIGYDALTDVNDAAAYGTIAIGMSAGANITNGAKNTVIGYKAGEDFNGANSTIIGYEAGLDADGGGTNATDSTLIGMEAGKHLDDGTYNTAIGIEAMKSNSGGGNTAIRNTAVGWRAGDLIRTGSDNVVIGHGAEVSATDAVNQIAIGKEAEGLSDNSVTLGNTSVTDVYMASDKGAKVHARALTLQDTSAFQMSVQGYNGVPAVIDLASAKGTIASPTDIDEANYILGRLRFTGYESSSHRTGAEIRGYTEGVWDGNTYNSYLSFMTVPNDNTATATEKLRVTSSNVELTSGQLKFPASQNASSDANTLDDYEEGTWTPAFPSNTLTGTLQGTYTKVGDLVTVFFNGQSLDYDGSGNSAIVITGLPFASHASSIGAVFTSSVAYWAVNITGTGVIQGYVASNTSQIELFETQDNSAMTSVKEDQFDTSAGSSMRFVLQYKV